MPAAIELERRSDESRDALVELLINLATALQRRGIYPATHPLVRAAVTQSHQRLRVLLEARPVIAIGVANKRLVLEGKAIDSDNPWLRELADRLRRHALSAIRFTRGVREGELANFLGAIAVDPRAGQPLGLTSPSRLSAWRHIRLYPIAGQDLELVEEPEPPAEVRARAAQLWGGLVAAALAEEEDESLAATGPSAVAAAIHARWGETAYEQVLIGFFVQILEQVRERAGAVAGLRRNMSLLILALREDRLAAMLDFNGDDALRQRILGSGVRGLTPVAAAKLLAVAARSWGRPVAEPLLALIGKAAAWASGGTGAIRGEALVSFRTMAADVLARWDLLHGTDSTAATAFVREHQSTGAAVVDWPRVVAIGLEVGNAGRAVLTAAESMARRADAYEPDDPDDPHDWSELHELLDILAAAPPGEAVDAVQRLVLTRDRLWRVMTTEPVDFRLLDRMLPLVGPTGADPMMDALVGATERGTRAKLLDRLVQLGPGIGPVVLEKLRDDRWFVQRNVLTLLGRLPAWPDGWTPHIQARHKDARVRREAYKMMLKEPSTREQAILDALHDEDESNTFLALGACREGCPPQALPILLSRVDDQEAGRDMRIMSIRAVAGVKDSGALKKLLALAMGRRSLLGRQRVAPKSPEMLAAVTGLAQHWVHDARAAEVVTLARASDDPEIIAAATPRPNLRS